MQEAAERLQKARRTLRPLSEQRTLTRDEIALRVLTAINDITDALRWLETEAGAQTRPEVGLSMKEGE